MRALRIEIAVLLIVIAGYGVGRLFIAMDPIFQPTHSERVGFYDNEGRQDSGTIRSEHMMCWNGNGWGRCRAADD